MNNSALFGVLASRASGCQAVITSRLNCGYWYTNRWIWLFRILNHYSTHILTNSRVAKEITVSVEKASPDKITVFYPGVNLARFARSSSDLSKSLSLGIPPAAQVVGIVANFRPVKDHVLFLRAAALVAASVPNATFLLVGQGPLKAELQHLTVDLGIAKRVFFSTPDVAVPDYLARMSVACLSSESEGLPNAILEYMAAGLPVVATDVGGVSELVCDGIHGFLVGTHTPEAFAKPIIRLLQDENLRLALGRNSLERAQAEFDEAAAIRRLQQLYIDATTRLTAMALLRSN